MKGSNTEEFIKKAIEKYGDRYDYSKVTYIKSSIHVIIICRIHGEFLCTPNKHLMNRGCRQCGIITSTMKQRKTNEKFISDAIKVHGLRYDYSRANYEGSQKNVDIICLLHGVFSQLANNHLNGEGCPECGKISMAKTQTKLHETFVSEGLEVYGEKYKYPDQYINKHTPINIWCTIHKKCFLQRPNDHIHGGQGCPECGILSMAKTQTKEQDIYIQQVTETHNGLYKYPNLIYINNRKKVEIECQFHGSFWQCASAHLKRQGCPHCKEWRSEGLCRTIFEEILQIKFPKSRPTFLGRKEFDGYNEEYKIAIEYNGKQHYTHIPFFHRTEEDFEKQKERDRQKRDVCIERGITLIEIPYNYNYQNIENMYYYIFGLLETMGIILCIR